MEDIINKPKHYTQGKIEVLDFIEDQKLDFISGNIIKYVCRCKYKGNELDDLKKAKFYIERLIRAVESR